MKAIDKLKAALMLARKERRKSDALAIQTILGDIETSLKGNPDSEAGEDSKVYGKVRKTIATNEDNIKLMSDQDRIKPIELENAFLTTLLPKELTADEIEKILVDLGPSDMGAAMGHLKETYAGRFNGGLASSIAKKVIFG